MPQPYQLPDNTRLLVVIPALNEEESLTRVIGNVNHAVPGADILVINDGSTDNTAKVGKAAGAMVVTLPYNLGIGAAMQTGFIYAHEHGYDFMVQVDGDGQHNPDEICELIPHLVSGNADVVIGSRYIEDRGYITPAPRRAGIIILAKYISLLTRKPYTDPTSGFRASNRKAIAMCSRIYPSDYPEPEALMQFHKANVKVKEIPVTMNPRYGGQSSITPIRSAYYMIKVMLAIAILTIRRRPKVFS